jgi:hypothetical protein
MSISPQSQKTNDELLARAAGEYAEWASEAARLRGVIDSATADLNLANMKLIGAEDDRRRCIAALHARTPSLGAGQHDRLPVRRRRNGGTDGVQVHAGEAKECGSGLRSVVRGLQGSARGLVAICLALAGK